MGLLRTVDRFNPEARRARDPQFQRGETLFDRYFGAFYPRLGKYSPDARFPAATAKARQRIAAAIGPVVNKLAGRAARKNDPERLRSVVVGPLARIIRPVLESPRSSVLGPVDTAPYYALKVEASALGTVGGPRTDAHGRALDTDGQRHSRACTPPATPAAPPPRASTEAPEGRSRSGWSSATSPDSTPPSTAPAATRKVSSTAHGTHQSPDHGA